MRWILIFLAVVLYTSVSGQGINVNRSTSYVISTATSVAEIVMDTSHIRYYYNLEETTGNILDQHGDNDDYFEYFD